MKKIALFVLSILTLVFTGGFFGAQYFTASASETVKTEAYMPASSLELYNLTSPISISYRDGYMVIAEYYVNPEDQTEFNKISVYSPETKKFTALPNHPSISNVTHAEYHNGYVYYLSSSFLYYVPVNDLSATPTKTLVTSSNFFSFTDDFVITNSSNSIIIYSIDNSGSTPSFTQNNALTFTTKLALLSSEKDVYYTQAGKLYCHQARVNMTSYLVGELGVDVSYMVECGNYIYYTSASGVYRIEKGKNKVPELLVESNPNAKGLGEFISPQGISVKNGNIIVADPSLKCVQEIDTATLKFTNFAITTESTADYRLTSNASKIMASENYVYVLDNSSELTEDGRACKRLVKISRDAGVNTYLSISLKPLYEENPEFEIELITASNTHLLLYDGKTLNLYEIEGLKKVYSVESETVTTLNYLDGDFYYTDKALNESLSAEIINVNKITLPSKDNELTRIKETKLTEESEITGSLLHSTIDVFGNVYLLLNDLNGDTKLIRYYNGTASIPCEINHEVISLKTDFSGSVYALSDNGVVYKYTYKDSTRNFEVQDFTLDTSGLGAKDIELNYRSNKCYVLSNACVLITCDDALSISNLSGVSADNLRLTDINENPTFLTVNKDAKLFKVAIGNYTQVDGVNYFKDITPISNPNTSGVYLVIADIGEDYYLVSYNQKLLALVRKNTVSVDPTFKNDATIISPNKYSDFQIEIKDIDNESYYVSNATDIYAKPTYDINYKTSRLEKGDIVKAIKSVKYNNFECTLITDAQGTYLGYVPSGYLSQTVITDSQEVSDTVQLLEGDNGRHFNESLMILIIAFTITVTLLFIEKKLLFDREK